MPVVERTTQPIVRALRYLDSAGYDRALTPRLVQFRLDFRMIIGRLQRFCRKAFFQSCIGFCWPLITCHERIRGDFHRVAGGVCFAMAYYFHRATVVSLPANILAVPLTEAVVVAAIVAVIVGYASLTLAKFRP